MFFKKEKREKFVSCEDCKCLLREEDAQKVEVWGGFYYYCATHKKPYEKKIDFRDMWGTKTFCKYFKELEVDEHCEPI